MSKNTLFESFRRHVVTAPDRTALIGVTDHSIADATVTLTWRQLAGVVDSAAALLRLLGMESSTTTPVFGHSSDNRICDVIIAIAVQSIGGTEVPLDYRLPATLRDQIWNRVGGVWVPEQLKSKIHHVCQSATQSDLADGFLNHDPHDPLHADAGESQLVLWTTGTTSDPKGVVLSQRSLALNAHAKLAAVPQTPETVRFTSLPIAHAYARTCDFGTWLLSGCTLAVSLGYNGWNQVAPSIRPTHANMTPGLAKRLRSDRDHRLIQQALSRLSVLGCGGAAMAAGDFQYWDDNHVRVVQGYGLTEAGPVICSATPANGTVGLVGMPVSGWETKFVDGELHVRGDQLMDGYFGDGVATAARIDSDGWLGTGDLAEVDALTGQYRILGRKDDVIVLENGFKIHPRSIEAIAESVAEVRHAVAALVGKRIELWVNTAAGRCSDDAKEIIDQQIRLQLPKWSWPTAVHCFSPPLSQQAGELTIKDTPRRRHVVQNRMG